MERIALYNKSMNDFCLCLINFQIKKPENKIPFDLIKVEVANDSEESRYCSLERYSKPWIEKKAKMDSVYIEDMNIDTGEMQKRIAAVLAVCGRKPRFRASLYSDPDAKINAIFEISTPISI